MTVTDTMDPNDCDNDDNGDGGNLNTQTTTRAANRGRQFQVYMTIMSDWSPIVPDFAARCPQLRMYAERLIDDLVTVGAIVPSQHGDVIAIIHQYAYVCDIIISGIALLPSHINII